MIARVGWGLVLVAWLGVAHAETNGERKAAYLAAKAVSPSARRGPAPKVGAGPRRLVNLYNTWTHEWLAVDAKRPQVDADTTSQFLRCHFTGARTAMEARLIPTVVAAAGHFGQARVDVVSGYRAPKYNLILRKRGRQVARDSQHTHGTAIDFRLPGVGVEPLYQWALARRLGGVGRYRGSGFVHIDSDRIRTWDGE